MALDVQRFLDDLTTRSAAAYVAAVRAMMTAVAMRDRIAMRAARTDLEAIIMETMGVAEVLGASQTLKKAAAVLGKEGAAFTREAPALVLFAEAPTQTLIPRVTLSEAVTDLVERTPRTIRRAAERTAARIAQLYQEGRVVAFVNSAERAVTERVQGLLSEAIAEGIPEAEAGSLIRMGVREVAVRTKDWTEGYARMAFRTNVNTAVTAGRFRQAQDPDVKKVVPAFRFDAIMDGDERDNHGDGDGKIMLVDNPEWNKRAPPLGYNCRCQVTYVTLPQLRRMGRVNADGSIREDRPPSSWKADAGFRHGGRPDLFIVEGARA